MSTGRAVGSGEKPRSAAFRAPKARALIVDDNNLNLKAAFRLISLYGVAADTASSGEEAVLAVGRTDYDIIFMDQMMPKMSGIEAVKRIRDLGGGYEKLPIVALTANAARGVQKIFLSSGFDDYISKPVDFDRLGEALMAWLPPEKIEEAPAAARAGPGGGGGSLKPGGLWEAVGRTGFINAEAGRNRSAGVESIYFEMLELFYGKLPRECEELEGYLRDGDLPCFAILAHGMKSSLATIGALDLSEMALQLEIAAREGDRLFCENNAAGFVECLGNLRARLAGIFDDGGAPQEAGAGDRVYLCENAKRAFNAARGYDGDAGLDAVGKLLKYDYGAETNALLKGARAALKNFDFEEALKLLRKVLKL